MMQERVAYFEIPEALAKELSILLTKQTIRERVLKDIIIEHPEKFGEIENSLVPIVQKIEGIKNTITNKYVPKEYRSEEYMWNYDGYEIDQNIINIYRAQ